MYPIEEYKRLEELVHAHRSGEKYAANEIIEKFKGFLFKFEKLLCDGAFNFYDKSIRDFMKLFLSESKRKRIHEVKMNKNIRYEMLKLATNLQETFRRVSREDIRQELFLCLLKLCKRYNNTSNEGYYLHTYIVRVFHYEFFRQIKELTEIGLLMRGFKIVPYVEETEDESHVDFGNLIKEDNIKSKLYIEESMDEINENWINGLTSSESFDGLTTNQRRILKMYYIDNKTDEEISEILGTCRATINRRRLKAISIIKDNIKKK